ncbi:hypothetical protein SK128_021489, partial [Halocaridina rubra]
GGTPLRPLSPVCSTPQWSECTFNSPPQHNVYAELWFLGESDETEINVRSGHPPE